MCSIQLRTMLPISILTQLRRATAIPYSYCCRQFLRPPAVLIRLFLLQDRQEADATIEITPKPGPTVLVLGGLVLMVLGR